MRRCALLLAVALALAACPPPIPVVTVRTNITVVLSSPGKAGAKTVTPDFSSQIDEIEVDLHSNDGYADPAPAFCHAAPWQVTVTDVPVGSWNLHVVARKGGVQVATADQNGLTLTAGVPLSVPITLSFTAAAATGSVQFTVSFPDPVGIDYVQGLLEETSDTSVPALSSAGGYTSGTFQFSNMPTGTYSLVMTFKRGGAAGTSAGIFREKVVVLGGFQSSGWVNSSGGLDSQRTFAANEFLEGDASLSGLVVSGTFTTGFSSSTYSYVGNLIPDASVTFTATGSISGQYIQYGWDGAALTEIGSGVVSPAHVTGATNTLQVRVTAPDRQTTHDYTVTFARGYALSYQLSGATSGSAPVDSAWHAAGAMVGVLGNTGLLVRPGLSFAGWNTAADGSGMTRLPGSTFAMPASDTVLYPRWSALPPVENLIGQSAGNAITLSWTDPTDAGFQQMQVITDIGASSVPKGVGTFSTGPFTLGAWHEVVVTAVDGAGVPLAARTIRVYSDAYASYPTGTGYSISYGGGTLTFAVDAGGSITIDSAPGIADLEIPASIAGHPVTALADDVCGYGYAYGLTEPTTVVIPDSVTSVGASAFEGCANLTSIVFPSHLTSLGTSVCCNCPSLVSASIPQGVNVPSAGFWGGSALTSVFLPEGMTYIGSNSFDATSLTSVSIPSSVTYVDWSAFGDCSALTTVSIYATTPPTGNLTQAFPFANDTALTAIYVPAASVTAYKSAPLWSPYAALIQAGTW